MRMLALAKWFGAGAVLASIGLITGGYLFQADRRHKEELAKDNERLRREREELVAVVQRLRLERRVADVEVLEQQTDNAGQVLRTTLKLTEIGRDATPLPAQVFDIPGRVPHFDALVIKFQDNYVERGDPLRGASLALFRRVYGESQAPEDGYWLGRPGDVPDVYRVSPTPSKLEVGLWNDFWQYATDPARAAVAGVRVAQGEAVYAPMTSGQCWRLTLEVDGGLNLVRADTPSSPATRRADATPGERSRTPEGIASAAGRSREESGTPLPAVRETAR
jgi:hypothetical protein